jgi:hypothetical protein
MTRGATHLAPNYPALLDESLMGEAPRQRSRASEAKVKFEAFAGVPHDCRTGGLIFHTSYTL